MRGKFMWQLMEKIDEWIADANRIELQVVKSNF